MNWELFRPSKATAVCLSLLLFSFLLMTFQLTSFVHSLRLFLRYWISPSYEISSELVKTSSGLGVRIAELVSAHEENRILKDKIKVSSVVEAELKESLNENQRLRKLLNLKSSDQYRGFFARVIGRDALNWNQSVIIDCGSSDGLTPDSAVLGVHGDPVDDSKVLAGVIGRVLECSANSSKILLISDPSSSIAVAISRNGEQGLLQGEGSYLMMIEYLNQTVELQIGDDVITSGLGGIFPSGLLIGKISKILKSSSGFKKVEVMPFFSLSQLREVFVLKRTESEKQINQEFRETSSDE